MKTAHDSEVPAHGQQVITACAFIHHEFDGVKKLFLPKRADTKKFLPGKFELPGGHIDFGENLVTGLKREIVEEFGVQIEVADPFAAFDYTNEVKGSHSVEVVYFARFADPIANIKLDPADHSEFIWFDGNNFDEIVSNMGGEDDPEFPNVVRGFELLKGQPLNF